MPPHKLCPYCGNAAPIHAPVCIRCSHQFSTPAPVNRTQFIAAAPAPAWQPAIWRTRKNRYTAALFAILLGGVGAHKFYLDQPWWGVLYLLLCWTVIPMLVANVEAVMYLMMGDTQFEAVHNTGWVSTPYGWTGNPYV